MKWVVNAHSGPFIRARTLPDVEPVSENGDCQGKTAERDCVCCKSYAHKVKTDRLVKLSNNI